MKVEFLSNMSHEFRTPINIILAIVQLLNLHNKPLGDEKYKEYLKQMDYGNKVVGNDIKNFWVDESLKINAFEQIKFLKKNHGIIK